MSTPQNLTISEAEWSIMRALWTLGTATSRELIDAVRQSTDWKEGTIKSLIARLTDKDYLFKDTQQSPFIFKARIDEPTAHQLRLQAAMTPICTTKRGKALLGLIQQLELSQQDCADLVTLLTTKQQHSPTKLTCHCPIGQCHCHHPSERNGC